MKKSINIVLFLSFILMMQSCIVSSRPNISYFQDASQYEGKPNFTSVNVPVWLAKPFVKSALSEDGDHDSEEVIALVKKIKKLKVLTVENADPKMVSNFAKYLANHNYEDWITIKHDGENVTLKALQDGDEIQKIMLFVQSDTEMVFVDVKGKFTPRDISDFINKVSVNDKVDY